MKRKLMALFTFMFLALILTGTNVKADDVHHVTVTYNSNGGTGTMDDTVIANTETANLTQNAFTKSGCAFVNWNTKADGTGTKYADGAEIKGTIASTEDVEITLYAQWKYYKLTIAYYKNGGTGSMSKQKVNAGSSFKLKSNKFKKSGYVFGGWNTKADGSGKAYANKADASKLAANLSKDTTVKLYAQWLLKAPTAKKLTIKKGTTLTVKWAKQKKVAGYQIQYSTDKKFKKSKTETVTAKKSATSADLSLSATGKTYYVRIRNYYKKGSKKIYSEWSNVLKKKVPKVQTIENQAKKLDVVSAQIKLSGSGTGYHAKLLLTTGPAAVSFGLQYDTACGDATYRSKAAYLCENITNAAVGSGGQSYTWFGAGSVNEYYTIMMTLDRSTGKVKCYVDGTCVGTVTNPGLKNQGAYYAGIEGVARVNGDVINASFKNIKFKRKGTSYDPDSAPGCNLVTNENAGIKAYYQAKAGKKAKKMVPWTPISSDSIVTIKGTLTGVAGDWDSAYTSCSSVVHIPYQ